MNKGSVNLVIYKNFYSKVTGFVKNSQKSTEKFICIINHLSNF